MSLFSSQFVTLIYRLFRFVFSLLSVYCVTKTKWKQLDIGEGKEFHQEDLVRVPFPQDNIAVYVELQGAIPAVIIITFTLTQKKSVIWLYEQILEGVSLAFRRTI